MISKQITVGDLAKADDVDETTARGLVNYLRAKGLAPENGVRPNASGRGKGSTQFDVDWSKVAKHFEKMK